MLQLQSPDEIRRRARANKGIARPQSHAQKKYFSLMLVPSYSSGKTRSVRIPHLAFYILFFSLLAVGAVMLTLHLRTQFFMQVAHYAEQSLEQVQEAYVSLQETTEEERRRLTEDSVNLRNALTQEIIRGQEGQYQQRQIYLETLEAIQSYVEGLEEQLGQFEDYRQAILDQLSSSAHIPPVRNMLNEMHQSQVHLLATLSDLSDYSEFRRERMGVAGSAAAADPAASAESNEAGRSVNLGESGHSMTFLSAITQTPEDAAEDLFDYIAMVELTLETKILLYSQLEQQVRRISPYIRNYPTLSPANGRLSSGFGWRRNPMGGGGSEMHRGVDIAAPTGTPIRATGGGTVIFSGWGGSYGNKVIIDHGLGIQTLYAHNSANLVQVGQQVSRGDTIARIGSTGRSTGPHVHYEVIVNGTAVNPTGFFLE